MGAWGSRNFENDSALDFVGAFTTTPSVENLAAALTTVINLGAEGEYIEVEEASAALAAAEILATVLGKPAPDFPAELRPALGAIHNAAALQQTARKAVNQVLKESELQELWAEGDDFAEWQTIQRDLVDRLK
ncbi:DUF4259 domain-containing protein [Hymenobacter sp. HMF4947]|uniref:DUF4259 domain-containing protein n=1 Tax=Hymenobacter ginkgonis TaxID=2682976 RepID=A0A7K1TBD4_9BACT|nr:DUF4259 domain-containing protein [Hymenobacter ginkgonis]MVN75693.1 DUF4259 domain-containing protein [Hymenobacter ginkgonis]